jgi:hypothetical protein
MGITMSLGVCERDCLCNGDGDVVCILMPLEWSMGHCSLDTNTIV